MAEEEEDARERRLTGENLKTLLSLAETILESFFNQLSDAVQKGKRLHARRSSDFNRFIARLKAIRDSAFAASQSLRESVAIFPSRAKEKSLRRVGMFGDVLVAKLEFLLECLRDGTASSILKTLNSILGSLAHVFGAADVLKEFKELMEAFLERLGPDKTPISLNLNRSKYKISK